MDGLHTELALGLIGELDTAPFVAKTFHMVSDLGTWCAGEARATRSSSSTPPPSPTSLHIQIQPTTAATSHSI